MSKIPCGRTKDDKYLSCKRKHRWYNSYWVIKKTKCCKLPKDGNKYKNGKFYWERRCLVCGSVIQLGGHPFERNNGW